MDINQPLALSSPTAHGGVLLHGLALKSSHSARGNPIPGISSATRPAFPWAITAVKSFQYEEQLPKINSTGWKQMNYPSVVFDNEVNMSRAEVRRLDLRTQIAFKWILVDVFTWATCGKQKGPGGHLGRLWVCWQEEMGVTANGN